MQNRLLLLLLSYCLLVAIACAPDTEPSTTEYQRGLTPWVFRSVLDRQPRMLTAALHEDLFVAYSAETGKLYKAWRGDVKLDGAVYTTAHGPQPESVGRGWLKDRQRAPWAFVDQAGQATPATPRYGGHEIRDGQLYLTVHLSGPGGHPTATVTERPEYYPAPGNRTGLERHFTVDASSRDYAVRLITDVQSVPLATSVRATGGELELAETSKTTVNGRQSVNLTATLYLSADQPTVLRTTFLPFPTLADDYASEAVFADNRQPGEKLIERNGCKTCHNVRVKTVGPAYRDIADRYPNTAANVDKLTAKVISGGSGNWGSAAMTAHEHIPPADIRTMVQWVMDLDQDTEVDPAEYDPATLFAATDADALPAAGPPAADGLGHGVRIGIYPVPDGVSSVRQVDWSAPPLHEGIAPHVNFIGNEWGKLEDMFAARVTGYFSVPETSNYLFRLKSDDGSTLTVNGQPVIDHDGLHGPDPRDGEIALAKGNHPFEIRYFENGGGQQLTLEWRSFFAPEWQVMPVDYLRHDPTGLSGDRPPAPMDRGNINPGDGTRLAGVHPSYDLTSARPPGFTPKVGGMDFLSDGRLAISTWDAEGAVYLLDGVQTGDPARITTQKIATGLAEPLGLKVVDDTIFVMQKQELTKLVDRDGDGIIDAYVTVSNDWETSANFHEFGFGLAYREPYFYAALAIGILPGGASAPDQPLSRGKAVRIHRYTGELENIASGLRTPNGINFGVDGELFIADNQGDWLPASKIIHVTEGDFFNSYAVAGERGKTPKPPVVWLPQDEIGNSPSTPGPLNDGPYTGQMIHGEVTHGGFKRVFVEQVGGAYQGTVFRFTQGLEAGVNRHVWGPDGALYVGMIGSTGNWGDAGKLHYGLQRLKYNGKPTFEVLAVRTEADGFTVEFTQPVAAGFGQSPESIALTRWYYRPTANYGGPKLNETKLPVSNLDWNADRTAVRLTFNGLLPEHVYHLRLPFDWTDKDGRRIWSTESWTTVNRVPTAAR